MADQENSDTRRVLHKAYSFVRGVEANKAAASLTLDHLLSEQIALYKTGEVRQILDSKGENYGTRISLLDELSNLEADVNRLVDGIKSAGSDQAKLAALGLSDTDLETEDSV